MKLFQILILCIFLNGATMHCYAVILKNKIEIKNNITSTKTSATIVQNTNVLQWSHNANVDGNKKKPNNNILRSILYVFGTSLLIGLLSVLSNVLS
jgi:hypothetical protein